MRSYQSVIVLKPDLDVTQLDQAIEKIEGFFKKSGGAVISLEKWGKKRLAYKIKKHKFGIYLNIYHTCECLKVSAMEKDYQLYDNIIKYLIIRLDDKDMDRIMKEIDSAAKEESAGEKSAPEVIDGSGKPEEEASSKPAAAE